MSERRSNNRIKMSKEGVQKKGEDHRQLKINK